MIAIYSCDKTFHCHRKNTGFTLIELLVVVAIVAILAGLLLPTISSLRDKGYQVLCLSNLRQHGIAWYIYLEENNGYFPNMNQPPNGCGAFAGDFGGKVGTFHQTRPNMIAQNRVFNRYIDVDNDASPVAKVFSCPADKPQGAACSIFDNYGNSYSINLNIVLYFPGGSGSPERRTFSTIKRPLDRLALEICNIGNNPGHRQGKRGNSSGKYTMVLFVDGHVGGPYFKLSSGVVSSSDFELIEHDDSKKVYVFPDINEVSLDFGFK